MLVMMALPLLLAGEVLLLVGRPVEDCSFVHEAVVVTVTVKRVFGVQKGQIVVVVARMDVNVSVMSDDIAHAGPVVGDAGGSDVGGAEDDTGGSLAGDAGGSLEEDAGGSEDVAGGSVEDGGSTDEDEG